MTEQETMGFFFLLSFLQQKLEAKEKECEKLYNELHELRAHAQTLQSRLSVADIVLDEVRRQLTSAVLEAPTALPLVQPLRALEPKMSIPASKSLTLDTGATNPHLHVFSQKG